jgi:hypothetical protein
MVDVNNDRPVRSHRRLRHATVSLVLGACALSLPSLGGQASTTFQVSIQVLPGPGVCAASVDANGVPLVNCRPTVIGGGTSGSGANGGGRTESVLGYRLPDARIKLAGALVEVGEESFHAWGEYSSRMITAGGIEYVEMTVTW